MRKAAEMSDPGSCFNKARLDERLFVLLARDVAAPAAIRAWVYARIRIGKNAPGDPQIVEALECASLMESERTPPAAVERYFCPRCGSATVKVVPPMVV